MRHIAAIAALLLLAFVSPAAAQEQRGITITGSATLSLKPDTARVFFGVVTVAPTLEAARSKNAASMQTVVAALKGLKLPESTTTTKPDGSLETTAGLALRTGDLTVELIYGDHNNRLEPPPIVGYRVTNSATARYTDGDVGKLGATLSRIVDSVLKNGANQIGRVEFSLRDDGEAEQKAMLAALASARLKAEALAKEAGVRIRGVRSIMQASYGYQGLNNFAMNQQGNFGGMGGAGGEATPLMAGALLFNGNVTVVYDIEGR
jgi:uncharacterized protein YggE